MATNTTNTKRPRSSLDKSIDLGMDQFGRFLRRAWIWLALLALVIWFFASGTTVAGIDPITAVGLLLQIMFAIFFVLVQFIAIFWFLGRPRLYWVMPGETGVTFEDYKGNPEVLESARRIVTLLQGVKEFQQMGGNPIRGLLLSGPPGTGKSYLAQCMSTEAGVPFAYASASSFKAMFMGMDVLMISNLYRKARRLAREYGGCVVFMDEIDAIGTARGANGPTMGMGGGMMGGMMGGGTGGLNQLLMEMDPPNIETGWFKKILRTLGLTHGRVQNEPVLTVGATNLPEALDQALLRPGRFDRQIHIAAPTDKYRPEVIEYYLHKIEHEPDISISALSARLVNYTPVAIKHVINEATIIAHFEGRQKVTYKDLIEAQDVHEYGLRQSSELTEIERRRLAYHEAGHTVASYYLMDRYFPAYVTIHMRGDVEGAAAFAHPRPKETVITHNREDILARIQVSLASRAAEELFLNTKLSGVTGDFQSATQQAALYIGAYGMDNTLASILAMQSTNGALGNIPRFSERVESLLQSQLNAVKQLFLEHSEALIAVAEALIEKDELVTEEIKTLIDNADARRVAQNLFGELTPLPSIDSGQNSNGNSEHNTSNGRAQGTGHLAEPHILNNTLPDGTLQFPMSSLNGSGFIETFDYPDNPESPAL
ncbi:AAA family ATPase [Dictyobacter arantiisoli]|uniref:ATPase n=1 Tax=Dictyobacter arantiisoli TaxID=2014874 RepID=A0A5A5T7V1_9CHLR|nr:AAA family ATPase [Dictyobacter arantiisoli]GCF07472.1 ATPase [Dictyobacter arantiisoli]